jgi:hypothetical protein
MIELFPKIVILSVSTTTVTAGDAIFPSVSTRKGAILKCESHKTAIGSPRIFGFELDFTKKE